MEFGLFMELSVPRPWTADSERQVYENALEQVRLADELGFDYIGPPPSTTSWRSIRTARAPTSSCRRRRP